MKPGCPGNHEKLKKVGDRIEFCPLRKSPFDVEDNEATTG